MALTSIVDDTIGRMKTLLDPIPFVDAAGNEGTTLGAQNLIYTYKIAQHPKPRTYLRIYEDDSGSPIRIESLESQMNKVFYTFIIDIIALAHRENTTQQIDGVNTEAVVSREQLAAQHIRYLREQIINTIVLNRNDGGTDVNDKNSPSIRHVDSTSPLSEGASLDEGYLISKIRVTLSKTQIVQD